MTQKFHISVTPVGNDEYLVRTEEVASGVPLAEELVSWPVEHWLKEAGQLMSDPLLGLFDTKVAPGHSSSLANLSLGATSLVTLGQQFYNGLFQGTLRDSWMCAQGIAQHDRQLLQLRLGLKARRLHRLPWEVLHAGDRPLASGTDVVFSRYQPGTSLLKECRTLPVDGPLKILVAIAAPSDQDSLQLKREVIHLQTELEQDKEGNRMGNFRDQPPEIQLTILEQPDRHQLTQALEQGQYHVLHYAGHSQLGAGGGELCLVSGRTGLTETLSGEDLAGLLVNNGIQMVVLNSCRGAYTRENHPTEDTGERNLAEALVQRGIPGVLAMAERIPDEVALTLTRLFYRNINQGYPVDLSLSRARAGLISAYGSHQLYWALPILYLHPKFDGYLMGNAETQEGESLEVASPLIAPERQRSRGSRQDLPSRVPGSDAGTALLPSHRDQSVITLEKPSSQTEVVDHLMEQLAGSGNCRSPRQGRLATLDPAPLTDQVSDHVSEAVSGVPGENTAPTQPWKRFSIFLLPIGLGALIAALSLWLLQPKSLLPYQLLPTSPITTGTPQPTPKPHDLNNLDQMGTSQVFTIAMEEFNQGNISGGKKAVDSLLKRGALAYAKAALANIPIDNNDPMVNFLRGRLAWESLQKGNDQLYSVDDVRRYWEVALKDDPTSLEYRNALGFAYYAEGELDKAYRIWVNTLELSGALPPRAGQFVSAESVISPAVELQSDILNAYAGLALVLVKSAPTRPAPQQQLQLAQARQLKQKVISQDPLNFQPNALSQNWLWSEGMIREWQTLR